MATYLIEQAPKILPKKADRATREAQKQDQKRLMKRRETACRVLAETCVFRCLRPDLTRQALERFIKLVLNPYYLDFRADLLLPFLRERGIEPPPEPQKDTQPMRSRRKAPARQQKPL